MLTPPFLKPGDSVGIAAPGRKISREDVKAASDILVSWGLNVVLADNLFSNAHNYMAGSDRERIDDLQQLLDDKNIKAIICARGGYGTTRILDRLDFSALTKFPKWIVGFSDITAMHLRLLKQGVESVHGTMPVLFTRSDSAPSIESLFKILTGESFVISTESNHHNRHGMATGQIIGGNLSIIVDAIGTPTDFDTNGKILIIEEVDEYTYRIDRMLIHLKRSGKLDNLAGLVVGHMTDIKETDLPFGETIEEVVLSKIPDLKYPVAFGFPIGHENPNLAWIHGADMTLRVGTDGAELLSRVKT